MNIAKSAVRLSVKTNFGRRFQLNRAMKLFSTNDLKSTIPEPDSPTRDFLAVPYDDKDIVKALGAKFDSIAKKWYVPVGLSRAAFNPWRIVYLNVPYDSREMAKAKGALFDGTAKLWYTRQNSSMQEFAPWLISDRKPHTSMKVPNLVGFMQLITTGLPQSMDGNFPPFNELSNYDSCRIVKISYIICDKTSFIPLETNDILIKPEGFTIGNSKSIGITTEDALKDGIKFSKGVEQVIAKLSPTENVFIHNAEYHINVLKSELYRQNLSNLLLKVDGLDTYCTMLRLKELTGKQNVKNDLKIPSLAELCCAANVDFQTDNRLAGLFESVKALSLSNRISI